MTFVIKPFLNTFGFMKKSISIFWLITVFYVCFGCTSSVEKEQKNITKLTASHAKGFSINKKDNVTIITVNSPWPDAKEAFTYALVTNKDLVSASDYDAVIQIPVQKIVVTSTTHIPALEALGVSEKLVGFPDTRYVSSPKTRVLIDEGKVKELGMNQSLNTEVLLDLNPDVVVGFSIDNQNKTYQTIQRSGIPVVYNGDWTEETPLGKAEWIKFFAPFFQKEELADSIFNSIEKNYNEIKTLASNATHKPTVFSGAMFNDVWYLPGGNSWAAQFLKDANANYLWSTNTNTGSLALNIENVLDKAQNADFWMGSSQFISYQQLADASQTYTLFSAYKNKKVYTFSNTKGATGGLLYYELAPARPDIVLKDLVAILHPEVLNSYTPYFFKPLLASE